MPRNFKRSFTFSKLFRVIKMEEAISKVLTNTFCPLFSHRTCEDIQWSVWPSAQAQRTPTTLPFILPPFHLCFCYTFADLTFVEHFQQDANINNHSILAKMLIMFLTLLPTIVHFFEHFIQICCESLPPFFSCLRLMIDFSDHFNATTISMSFMSISSSPFVDDKSLILEILSSAESSE